jgi:hypothetical protein
MIVNHKLGRMRKKEIVGYFNEIFHHFSGVTEENYEKYQT